MDQGQGQDQAQGYLQLQQRAALPHLLMALSLVLALVRNNIFSKVRVLVLNKPILLGEKKTHETVSPEWGQRPNGRGQRTNRTPELGKTSPKAPKIVGFSKNPPGAAPQNLKSIKNPYTTPCGAWGGLHTVPKPKTPW